MRNQGLNDVLGKFSDELMRQCFAELIQVQTERNKLRLQRERSDGKALQRLIATAAVIAVLTHVWF